MTKKNRERLSKYARKSIRKGRDKYGQYVQGTQITPDIICGRQSWKG